ncbi:hypothetical protein [Burkholderia sp. Bp9031]|nr:MULTISPECIES: hypothetical protein [Burkholderia]
MPTGFQQMNANGDDFVVDLRGRRDAAHRIDRGPASRMGARAA